MMATANSLDLDQDSRSIIGTRIFDAPRDLVFTAFTDPKHLAQWWGPNGFTTTTSAFDFRPIGGQGRAVHRQQRRDVFHVRRFRPIERHQQRKLTLLQIERPEGVIEAPCQSACGALDVQAQAMIAHMQRQGERHFAAIRGAGRNSL
jgi:hypothetical protein